MGGALLEAELVALAAEAGLIDGRVVARFFCFDGTSVSDRLSAERQVQGVTFFARKP